MGLLKRVSGVGTALMLWSRFKDDFPAPPGRWFGARFIGAASMVVDRWGPAWTRKRLLVDIPIGAWLLLILWLGLPTLLIINIW